MPSNATTVSNNVNNLTNINNTNKSKQRHVKIQAYKRNNSLSITINNKNTNFNQPLEHGNHYNTRLTDQQLLQVDLCADKRVKREWGPHYSKEYGGIVTRERVKLGEKETNGQIYEFYMTCLTHLGINNYQELNEELKQHIPAKPHELPTLEDDYIQCEESCVAEHAAITVDKDALKAVSCGSLPSHLKSRFNKMVSTLPQAYNRTDIGCLAEEFEIRLKPDSEPCHTAQYASAHMWSEEIRRQCMELFVAGFIRRSNSEYQSAILFVSKPDDTWRMCFDYRKLNAMTIPDKYNLPNINTLFTKFRGKKYFSSFDMRSAYHNIVIAEKDRHKTAFITPWGLFEWNRLTFGLRNAPAHFQRCMDKIFQKYDFVLVYLDDIFVMSETADEHMEHLEIVAEELRKLGLKTRLSKCNFFAKRVKYLGHIVTPDGFHPDQKYVAKVLQFKKPTNKDELARYLGMVNWLLKFIPNLAQAKAILERIKGKGVKFNWNWECDEAFKLTQKLVSQTKILHHPDFKREFFVQTDASNGCIGAMLFQYDDNGNVCPIEFMSQKLQGAELNWHSNEKECFAVLMACKKWFKFLLSAPFTILTDHKNLEVLLTSVDKIAPGRVHRWATWLQAELIFTVRHIKGTDNILPDLLSRDILRDTPLNQERANKNEICMAVLGAIDKQEREYLERARRNRRNRNRRNRNQLANLPVIRRVVVDPEQPVRRIVEEERKVVEEDSESDDSEGGELEPLLIEDPELDTLIDYTTWDEYLSPALIKVFQRTDPLIGILLKALNSDERAKFKLAYRWQKRINKGIVFISQNGLVMINDHKIMVPDKLQQRILDYFHSTNYCAHQGITRMKSHICSRFYWVNMQDTISKYVANCRSCAQVKGGPTGKNTKLKLFPSRYPNHMVAVDTVELPHSQGGYKHMVTMIDRFSRYAVAVPVKNKTSPTVIKAILNNWIYKFGVPEHILSDNGPEFIAKAFKQFVNRFKFKHKHSTVYHPQTNGMVERLHRYIKQRMVLAAIDQELNLLSGDEWFDLIPPIMFAYNSTITRMTGYSPHELIFARSPLFPIDLELNTRINNIECQGSIHKYTRELEKHRRAIFEKANVTQNNYDAKRKAYYDRDKSDNTFEVGDHITLYDGDKRKGKKRKFRRKWFGIWIIREKYANNAVLIEEISLGTLKKVNVSKIKRVRWHIDQTI